MILVTGSTVIISSALIEELAASHSLAHPPPTNKQRYERVLSKQPVPAHKHRRKLGRRNIALLTQSPRTVRASRGESRDSSFLP
jgi:hypothetical protein